MHILNYFISVAAEFPRFVETVTIDSAGRPRLKVHRLDFAPKSVWPQLSPGTALLPVFPGKLRKGVRHT